MSIKKLVLLVSFVAVQLFAGWEVVDTDNIEFKNRQIGVKDVITYGNKQFATIYNSGLYSRTLGDTTWDFILKYDDIDSSYLSIIDGRLFYNNGWKDECKYSDDGGKIWHNLYLYRFPLKNNNIIRYEDYYVRIRNNEIDTSNGVYKSVEYLNWDNVLPADSEIGNLTNLYKGKNKIYATTWNGLISSDDGGKSWDNISVGLPERSETETVIEGKDSTLLISNNSGLYRSINFGKSWNLLDSNFSVISTSDNNRIIKFIKTDSYIFAISKLAIYKMDLDGNNIVVVNKDDTNGKINSFDIYDSTISIARECGVEISYDLGANWTLIKSNLPTEQVTYSANISNDTIYLNSKFSSGKRGLHRSLDNGNSWENLEVPENPVGFGFDFFSSKSYLTYAFIKGGRYPRHVKYYSYDGGKNWDNDWGKMYESLDTMRIYDTPDGRIITSSDGGKTWENNYSHTGGNKGIPSVYTWGFRKIDSTILYHKNGRYVTGGFRISYDNGATFILDTIDQGVNFHNLIVRDKNIYTISSDSTQMAKTGIDTIDFKFYNIEDSTKLDSLITGGNSSMLFATGYLKEDKENLAYIYSRDLGKNWNRVYSKEDLDFTPSGATFKVDSYITIYNSTTEIYRKPLKELEDETGIKMNNSLVSNFNEIRTIYKQGNIQLSFNIKEPQNYRVAIYTLLGRFIGEQSGFATAGENSVNMSNLNISKGIYISSVIIGNNKFSNKFLIK